MKMYGRMMDTVKMAPATINDTWHGEKYVTFRYEQAFYLFSVKFSYRESLAACF